MASKKGSGYWFGTDWVISIILAIIPVVNWWLGVFHRIAKKNYVGAIVYVFFGWVLGFVDLITIILGNEITVLA